MFSKVTRFSIPSVFIANNQNFDYMVNDLFDFKMKNFEDIVFNSLLTSFTFVCPYL